MDYTNKLASQYFWRTTTGAELDYVEVKDGSLYGYEFKAGNKFAKLPKSWAEHYKGATSKTINRGNYLEFIT